MHHAGIVLMEIFAVLAACSLIYGLAGALLQRGSHRDHSFARVWLGVFGLMETLPRLAGWSSGAVLALSIVAFAPILLAGRFLRRTAVSPRTAAPHMRNRFNR